MKMPSPSRQRADHVLEDGPEAFGEEDVEDDGKADGADEKQPVLVELAHRLVRGGWAGTGAEPANDDLSLLDSATWHVLLLRHKYPHV